MSSFSRSATTIGAHCCSAHGPNTNFATNLLLAFIVSRRYNPPVLGPVFGSTHGTTSSLAPFQPDPSLSGRSAMRTRMRIIIASMAAALCCAYIAHGQNREKVADTPKKAPPAAGDAAQSPQKPVNPSKKPAGTARPADTAKSATARPAAAPAPVESPDEKAIRASAEAFTK